jgi:YidC/Oxa1 family membrane protein insertase
MLNNTVERNQAIGLVLISAMLIAYFTFFSETPKTEQQIKTEQIIKKQQKDIAQGTQNQIVDTAKIAREYGTLASYTQGNEQSYVLENENLKVTFSNKGGSVQSVLLKKYKTYSKADLYLLDEKNTSFSLLGKSANGEVNFSNLYYQVKQTTDEIIFTLTLGDNSYITHSYKLNSGYDLAYNLKVNGLDNVISTKELQFVWKTNFPNTEKDFAAARQTANITYRLLDGTYKSLNETSTDTQEQKLETQTNWVTFKQKFFSIGFIANNSFKSGVVKSEVDLLDSSTVKSFSSTLNVDVEDIKSDKGSFKFYFGPNKLSLISDVAPDFKENVYLGWPVINTINRYTMAPLLSFLEKFIPNYGIIIILMVLIIKLILLPLSYKAFVSMAKMKVLKPELDEIKARVGDDMGAMQQEQMKLYNQVGVNPLSGCVPVLLQMPILLAMFNFFPNAIELRQQSFLWAEDLSTFDSVASLPFKIPFYGDHVSLFALLMTASTILYTWYNNQMNVAATGPMIAMSYIMPLVFMFILNSMPAGLSFYYFVSNMVTIGQQFLIKSFVDEKAIREKLIENKNTAHTRKPNRFQQRLMDAMEQQKELKKGKK